MPEEPTGPHFSVLTYNVNYGMAGCASITDAILEADADIVCLQETNARWERHLKAAFGKKYPNRLFLHHTAAGGLAFLSKSPFEFTRKIPPTAGWFPAAIITAETPVGPVQIMSVHLRPSVPFNTAGSLSITPYFEAKKVRKLEIVDFAKHLDGDVPAIVVGDFNEDESGKAVRHLLEQDFTDSLPEFDRSSSTWEWPFLCFTLDDRYDHIIYCPKLYCLSSAVFKTGGSDHFPVKAVFESVSLRDKR
jgi:endonuclease/exonuclease/phosphatase family metal-dependent hydrolase